MATLRIRSYGVNGIDMSSLKSMLTLSDERLHSEWTVTSSGRVDLYLYSDETAEGLALFQQHKQGISAVLSSRTHPLISADLHIKKPLRATQLADTLNEAEQKIVFARRADQVASISKNTPLDNDVNQANRLSKTKKSTQTLLSSISRRLSKNKLPASGLPPLTIYTLDKKAPDSSILLDPDALSTSISALPQKDKTLLEALLDKLIPLNRCQIHSTTRLALLECYLKPVHNLIFERNADIVKLEMSQPHVFEAHIKQLNLFLDELTLGYKTIVMDAYKQGYRPATNEHFLFAIIRCAELISLSVIQAFRYYLVPPAGAIHDLHQLYLYCEADQVLTKKAAVKTAITKKSFSHLYNQLMLTGIADPYSLDKFDVFRLYHLMAKMADKVEVNILTPHHKAAKSTAILTSYFCIDCTSDLLPIPLHHMSQNKRQLAETRMLNPQGVLLSIEQVFQAAASITGMVIFDLDVQLLKRVIPQFNANYQRQFQRLASVPTRQVKLADGITAIYDHLNQANSDSLTQWTVGNQGSGGMMLRCDKKETVPLNIGGLMGVFEQNLPPRLATVRWLQTDHNDTIQIGLQSRLGTPRPIHLTADNKTTVMIGLLLPKMDDIKQDETIIITKGIYTPNRVLRVKDAEKTYTIMADKLLDNTLDYEQFSFKLKPNPS